MPRHRDERAARAQEARGDLAGAERTAPYNHSSFWKDYLALCQASFTADWAGKAFIITSDDVFDYLLNIRTLNEGIDRKREDLLQEFLSTPRDDHFVAERMEGFGQGSTDAGATAGDEDCVASCLHILPFLLG